MFKRSYIILILLLWLASAGLAQYHIEASVFTCGSVNNATSGNGTYSLAEGIVGQSLGSIDDIVGQKFLVNTGFVNTANVTPTIILMFSDILVNDQSYNNNMEISEILKKIQCKISPVNWVDLNSNNAIYINVGQWRENVQQYYDVNTEILTYDFSDKFGYGHKVITVEALSIGGVWSKQIINVTFKGSGDLTGPVYVNPLVFRPLHGDILTFGYELADDKNIEIMVLSIDGRLVWRQKFAAGVNGGRVGYNRATWNGRFAGSSIGNGIYLYQIISDGKLLHKGKFVVSN
jgi:hypothetical protein